MASKSLAPELGARRTAPIENINTTTPSYWRRWEWQGALLDALARHEITPAAFAIGIALSVFADNRTGESRPSVAAIAKKVGAPIYKGNDSRTVRDALAALERAGLVEIIRRGHMKPNLYRPHCPFRETGDRRTAADMIGEPPPIRVGDDRRTTAGMIGERPPTNFSTELPNHSLSLPMPIVASAEPSGAAADVRASDEFDEFIRQFPFKASMDRAAAWREFSKLDLTNRRMAIEKAGSYASACESDGIQFPRHPARWLRELEFETGHIDKGQAQSSKVRVFVAAGTPAFAAWVEAGHKPGLTTQNQASRKTGWWFTSEFPSEGETLRNNPHAP